MRERVCFGGAVFAVDEEGWGFVAILSDSLDPDTSKIRSGCIFQKCLEKDAFLASGYP